MRLVATTTLLVWLAMVAQPMAAFVVRPLHFCPHKQTTHNQRRSTLLLQAATTTPARSCITMYNSQTRQKQIINGNKKNNKPLTMYTCGPTVYDSAHIGNFRAFLTYDILKRVLLYFGYTVQHVCNITDVDDKILARANVEQVSHISTVTLHYETLFFQDLHRLNCIPASVYPRATQHIPAMMRLIQDLYENGLAYETSDGSWYFDTQRQAGYGQQLVQLHFDDMEQQQQQNESTMEEKRHFADFCLWKAFKEGSDRMDAAWELSQFANNHQKTPPTNGNDNDTLKQRQHTQPWPRDTPIIQLGRPGWHLECSAMAQTYFGTDKSLDFHGGGIDLKFPHHENEIAQSQGVNNNQPFCECWFHNGFVTIGEEKMSKSLGNFLTLTRACTSPLEIRAYRYLVVTSQYRSALTFTDAVMEASKKAVRRLDKVLAQLKQAVAENPCNDSSRLEQSDIATTIVPMAMENFEIAIADDLGMPRAKNALFDLVKAAEQEFKAVKKIGRALDVEGLQAILDALEKMDLVFGIFYTLEGDNESEEANVPPEVLELVGQRTAAKQDKDWELADSLRKRITELGFAVKDVKGGDPIVTPVEN